MTKKVIIYTTILFFSLTLFALAQVLVGTECDLEKCRINNGDSLEITTTCTPCRKVTNNSGGHIFVPISTCNEWNAFLSERTGRDGVSVGECSQVQATPTVTFNTPTYGISQPLTWTRITTASGGYRVEVQRNGGSWTLYNSNVSQPASGTTVTLTIPSSEFNSMGTRRFRVRANASGSYLVGGWGYSSTRTIQKANQSAPSTPTCSSSTQNSVTISSCTGCEYRRGTLSAQSSNVFTGLTAGTSYTFSRRLAETTTHNASAWSANVTCTTQAPSASGSLSCGGSTQNSITLSYSYSNGSSVSLFRGSTRVITFGSGSSSGSHTVSGLSAGTSYNFYLRNGTSSSSTLLASRSCSTANVPAPSTPINVTCNTISSSQINISWSAVSGATGYNIIGCVENPSWTHWPGIGSYWSYSACTPSYSVANPSGTSWTHSGLNTSTTYRYRVRAYNSSGASNYSPVTSCCVPLQTANACGGQTTVNMYGKNYPLVSIGNQCWMAKSMDYDIYLPDSGYMTDSYCKDNNTSNCTIYGRLYPPHSRYYVCPSGWRLPEYQDWKTLLSFLADNCHGCNYTMPSIAKALAGKTGWSYSQYSTACDPSNNPQTNNSSGFSALPGGSSIHPVGHVSMFWGGALLSVEWQSSVPYLYGEFMHNSYYIRCLKN
jgi:uncharacterized protein (TIGR02145 family)